MYLEHYFRKISAIRRVEDIFKNKRAPPSLFLSLPCVGNPSCRKDSYFSSTISPEVAALIMPILRFMHHGITRRILCGFRRDNFRYDSRRAIGVTSSTPCATWGVARGGDKSSGSEGFLQVVALGIHCDPRGFPNE